MNCHRWWSSSQRNTGWSSHLQSPWPMPWSVCRRCCWAEALFWLNSLSASLCRSFTHFLTGVCAIIGGVFTGESLQVSLALARGSWPLTPPVCSVFSGRSHRLSHLPLCSGHSEENRAGKGLLTAPPAGLHGATQTGHGHRDKNWPKEEKEKFVKRRSRCFASSASLLLFLLRWKHWRGRLLSSDCVRQTWLWSGSWTRRLFLNVLLVETAPLSCLCHFFLTEEVQFLRLEINKRWRWTLGSPHSRTPGFLFSKHSWALGMLGISWWNSGPSLKMFNSLLTVKFV